MLRKILIPSLIIGFFIIAIVSPVSAVDKTLEDDLEDVIDMVESTDIDEVYTDEKPNIDIHKIYYTKDGTSVTITMEMNDDGVIENRGNIDNPEALDMVSYLCALTMEGAAEWDLARAATCGLTVWKMRRTFSDRRTNESSKLPRVCCGT